MSDDLTNHPMYTPPRDESGTRLTRYARMYGEEGLGVPLPENAIGPYFYLAADVDALLAAKDAEIAVATAEATDKSDRLKKYLDQIWQLAYPGETDWEYPDQVIRHVRDHVAAQAERIGELERQLSTLEDADRAVLEMLYAANRSIAALRAEIAREIESRNGWRDAWTKIQSENERLKADVARLTPDAEAFVNLRKLVERHHAILIDSDDITGAYMIDIAQWDSLGWITPQELATGDSLDAALQAAADATTGKEKS